MLKILYKYGTPKHFYKLANVLAPWLGWITVILLLAGLYDGLVIAPADYQQGEAYRIMFVHVPAAWMSLFIYIVMAGCAVVSLVWRTKLSDIILNASAPIGASFTFIALVTGSLWGKPMWGTWWMWDARLTSELILLFLYFGILALSSAVDDKRVAGRAVAILTLVGVVNIPIIHYSVNWWHSLHQSASVMKASGPAISGEMLLPLLIMAVAFKAYYGSVMLVRANTEILEREKNTSWVKELVGK